MNLAAIVWPVFRLGEHKPKVSDGIVFYSKEYGNNETGDKKIGLRIVDDKNIAGETLGIRRLKIQKNRLFPIRSAVYLLVDLIKLAKQTTWFIDSHGNIFQYKKITRAKLICKRIKNIIPAQVFGALVEVEGINQRFKIMYRPQGAETYAGVLRWGLGYILYGLYEQPFKTTYRLV